MHTHVYIYIDKFIFLYSNTHAYRNIYSEVLHVYRHTEIFSCMKIDTNSQLHKYLFTCMYTYVSDIRMCIYATMYTPTLTYKSEFIRICQKHMHENS